MSENYTFELETSVKREHVSYLNRYGILCVADLYYPKNLDQVKQYPAIVIGPPYAGCKEQGPGVYANQLAKRGFVALAFDPVFMGESGGEPRHVSSPDMFSEGFSAGVDFLGTLQYVNRNKIGAIGICGSGGFALSAAQVDTRIKAIATASMFDVTQAARLASPEQISSLKDQASQQRWIDFENKTPEWLPAFPEEPTKTKPAGLDPVSDEFYEYYGMKRGHHINARGNFTTTSQLSMLQFPLLAHIEEISPRPIFMAIGENAQTNLFSQTAFENALEPKELYIVPNANHIDLYDDINKIPFDKITEFFNSAFTNL